MESKLHRLLERSCILNTRAKCREDKALIIKADLLVELFPCEFSGKELVEDLLPDLMRSQGCAYCVDIL